MCLLVWVGLVCLLVLGCGLFVCFGLVCLWFVFDFVVLLVVWVCFDVFVFVVDLFVSFGGLLFVLIDLWVGLRVCYCCCLVFGV